jgi:acetyl esterase/lipase
MGILAGVTSAPLLADPEVGDGGVDAFYRWSTAVPKGPPRIVRRETLPPARSLAQASVNDRILHTSRGGPQGERRIVVSGVVYLPRGEAPAGGWPVIAWAHGTVGFPDICAPSFAGWSERDTAYLDNWLGQGYAVVASDYEGLGTAGPHPYMMTRSEATGVLDAVRAARGSYPLAEDVVLVGQSQGAHAAANAGLMQKELAPELRIRGIVLTGWPGSMDMRAVEMDEFDPWAILYLRFLPTYTWLDPTFRPGSVLTPAGRAVYEGFRTTCGPSGMQSFLQQKPVTSTLFALDPSPLEARAQPHRAYPPLRFPVPVFLGIGLRDEQTSPRASFESARRACDLGSRLEIRFYPGMMHGPTVLRSQQDSIPWVRAAFDGKAGPGNCDTATFPAD